MLVQEIRKLTSKVFPNYKQSRYYPFIQKSYHKLMEINDSRIKGLASKIDRDDPIIMYSIGGRYGLPSVANYLREKKLLVGIGFEPDTEEAQLLEENNAFDRVLPYALGSENGIQKLNLTKNAACSSILIPHKDNLSFFCGDTESFEIQKKIDIEVYRLDEIIQKEELLAPDLLQIDTQGFEFEVLTGSTNILEYVSIVELEVHMYPLYVDEKMFADIHQFMTEKGFVLYRLEKSNAYGINYVEANACYYNKRIMNESRKSKFFIDYCNISYELV